MRARVYETWCLFVLRAPCLLEENELPVAQWQEYDKAFTCVSRYEREEFCVFFFGDGGGRCCFGRAEEEEGAPSRSYPSLLCLTPRDAS